MHPHLPCMTPQHPSRQWNLLTPSPPPTHVHKLPHLTSPSPPSTPSRISLQPNATQSCTADAAILQDGAAPRRKPASTETPEIDPSAPSRASGPLSRSTDFQFFAALLSPVLERLEGSVSSGSEVASVSREATAEPSGKRQKRLAARVAVTAAGTPPRHDSMFWNTCSRCDAHAPCL